MFVPFQTSWAAQDEETWLSNEEVAFAMRRGIYDLLTIIPVEHLTVGVEFVMDIIFVHLHELYDDSMYEKAVNRWTPFWSTYL